MSLKTLTLINAAYASLVMKLRAIFPCRYVWWFCCIIFSSFDWTNLYEWHHALFTLILDTHPSKGRQRLICPTFLRDFFPFCLLGWRG